MSDAWDDAEQLPDLDDALELEDDDVWGDGEDEDDGDADDDEAA